MPRQANAKVWNEDLVTALNARAEFARQQGKQRHHLWSEGARLIQNVRQDIYAFKTGRIVGLPETKLKKTVAELCRNIVNGNEPVLPPGYTPPNLAIAAHGSNSSESIMTRDHYLNHIKVRGGAFAILMVFYTRGFPMLTQDQLCEYAQPFCDEPMQANYMAGRPHGAWSGHKTLVSHQLLLQQKPQVQFRATRNGGHGFRTALGARATYSLTDKGKLFVSTLLEHRPEAKQEVLNYGGGGPRALGGGAGAGFAASINTGGGGLFASPVRSAAAAAAPLGGNDEQDLRSWARTAAIGDSRVFNVSKAKRETLHNLCDFLSNTTLQAQGRRIHHASQGAGRNRTLVVTMERSNMPALPGTNSVGGVHAFDDSPFDVHSHAIASHNVAGTPPKRARTANQAAAEAAMLRAALHESALMVKKPPAGPGSMAPRNLYDDNVSCNLTNRAQTNQTTAANSKRSRPAVKSNHAGPIWLDGLDDDSDDDEAWLYESAMKLPSVATKTTTPNVLELSDSSDDDGDSLSPRLVLDDDSDDDEAWLYESAMKLPSVATKTTTPNVLELSDSSDDDGDSLSRKTAATRVAPLAKARSISFDDDKQVENVIDLTEEDASPRASAATYTPTTHQQQPKLTIYIDDRERNKNATPRMLRMELTRMLTTGLLRRVWPSSQPAPQVEERKLARGDFAFESTLGSSTFNFPVAIERKTIADIVQRSVHQDHWKQLCQMRDGFELCVFLLEGDMRTAVQHTAYGAQHHEDTMSPMTHKIDDADSLIRFVGRALLTTPSFRLVMTEHEQGSLQAVAAFGLMSMFRYVVGKTPLSTPPKKLMSQASAKLELKDRLQNGGIPWQVAKLVSDEIGSIVQMSRLYENAQDEECRDALLTPLLGDVIREVSPLRGTAEHWSAAVHRVFYSPHSDVGVGRKALHDFQDIVTDHASLLANVHSAMSAEDALDKTLNLPDKVTASVARLVHIELPELLEDCFPQPEDGEDTIYDVNVVRDESDIAKVTMHTCAGGFRSASLCIFLFDGEEIISRIQDKIKYYPAHFVEIARSAAEDLHKACSGDDDRSQRILLIRGLGNALTKAAKKAGYRSELPVLVDMFQAQLSLAHEMVVLHAARLNDDREMILQQLAMACYHFQLLLFKADQ